MLALRNSLLSIVLTVMVVLLHGTEARRCRFGSSTTSASTTGAASETYSATAGTPTQAASTGVQTGTASSVSTKNDATSVNSTMSSSSGGKRGLAWAIDNKYATTLGTGDISWVLIPIPLLFIHLLTQFV